MELELARAVTWVARRRFFVNEVRSGRADIVGDQAHHLARVLRIERGQKFEISDNRNVFLAHAETVRKDFVSFTIVEPVAPAAPHVAVTLIAALIRFERFEWMLEKATELGVHTIVPFEADRSEKGLAAAAAKRITRWRKIVREASEQSRRDRLPEVGEAATGAEIMALRSDFRIMLDEAADTQPIACAVPEVRRATDHVALLVGPEGGWTERERRTFREHGWTGVSLGPTILRAETAAIVGLAVLGALWHSTGAYNRNNATL